MSETMRSRPRYGQAHSSKVGRDDAARAVTRRRFEAATQRAALLRVQGEDGPIIALIADLMALMESGPALPLPDVLTLAGDTNRAQDEARDRCAFGSVEVAHIELIETRTRRDIARDFGLLRSCKAVRHA